jgi:hypothetical protein
MMIRLAYVALATLFVIPANYPGEPTSLESGARLQSLLLDDDHRPEPQGDDPVVIARQAVLDPAADLIEQAVRSSDPGFGDIEVDAVQNQLIVHRVGGYPVDHEGGIKDLYAATIPAGIKVEFSRATLTKTEVQALMDLTASAVPALDSGSRLTYWGLDHIGGDFTVSYAGNLPDSQYTKFAVNLRNKRTQGVGNRPYVSDQLLAKVKFRRNDVDELSRLADIKQYYGGSRVHFPNFDTKPGFESASSGWPVRSPSGLEYLTTAWHTYKPTDPRVWTNIDYNNVLIGSVTSTATYSDTAFIRTDSSPFIFTGTYPDQSTSRWVAGWQGARAGDLVCTSGSYSYARCNVRVGTAAGWGVTNAYTGQGHGVNGSSVASTDGAWISAKGDSGGPVFRYNNNQSNVSAYGMVSAGDTASVVSCPSWIKTTCYTAGKIALAQDIVLSNNISFSW